MTKPLALAATGSNAWELMLRIARLVGVESPRRPRRGQAAGVGVMVALVAVAVLLVQARRQAKAADAAPTVVVRCVDARGQAAPAVTIKMAVGSDEYDGAAGDDGRATLQVDLSKASRVVILTSGGGWVPMRLDWNRQKNGELAPAQFDIVMERPATIGGTVADEDGKPLTHARLMMQMDKKFAGHPGQRVNVLFTTVFANDQGVWTLENVPEQFDSLKIGIFDPECLGEEGFYDFVPYADLAALHARTAKLVAPRGTPVSVEVRGPDGNPAPGARIAYGSDRVASNVYPEIHVGEDGKVQLGIKPGTQATLTFHAPGASYDYKQFTVGKEPMTVVMNLGPEQKLTGQVVDKDGNGIPAATVIFDSWQRMRPFDERITADPDGKFEWVGAPKSEIFVDVFGKGFAVKRGVKMEVGKENKVALAAPTVFKGMVVDAETGLPLKDFEVYFGVGSRPMPGMVSSQPQAIGWQPQVHAAPPSDREGGFEFSFTENDKRAIRVAAPGYLPSDSPLFPVDGNEHSFTFRLVKGEERTGNVVDGEGKPVAEARVYMLGPNQSLEVHNGTVESTLRSPLVTDEAGKFTVPPSRDPYLLVVAQEAGFAEAQRAVFEKDGKLVLQEWARVEGVAMEGSKPLPHTTLVLRYDEVAAPGQRNVDDEENPVTDGEGKFVVERIYSNRRFRVGILRTTQMGVGQMIGEMRASERSTPALVAKPGETVRVQIGGGGRALTGRVEVPAEVKGDFDLNTYAQIEAVLPPLDSKTPLEVMEMPDAERRKWEDAFEQSEEGRRQDSQQMDRMSATPVSMLTSIMQPDGTIRVPDVKPGRYRVSVRVYKQTDPKSSNGSVLMSGPTMVLGLAARDVVVPELVNGDDAAVDLGVIKVEKVREVQVGDAVPEMRWTGFDDKIGQLSNYKGKVVVLEMWMTHRLAYLPQAAVMDSLWQTYGKSDRVAILSICRNRLGMDDARRYLAAKKYPWPTAYFDEGSQSMWGDALMPMGTQSEMWVIGADGKLLARGIRGDAVKQVIEKALGN